MSTGRTIPQLIYLAELLCPNLDSASVALGYSTSPWLARRNTTHEILGVVSGNMVFLVWNWYRWHQSIIIVNIKKKINLQIKNIYVTCWDFFPWAYAQLCNTAYWTSRSSLHMFCCLGLVQYFVCLALSLYLLLISFFLICCIYCSSFNPYLLR